MKLSLTITIRQNTFRQWVACITMGAMLLGTLAPPVICQCEGCGCSDNAAQYDNATPCCQVDTPCCQVESAAVCKSCCCKPPEKSESSKSPCSCQCCDTQKSEAVRSKAVLPVQKPGFSPLLDIALPAGLASDSDVLSYIVYRRALPPPHVPLHVLLCVFLN